MIPRNPAESSPAFVLPSDFGEWIIRALGDQARAQASGRRPVIRVENSVPSRELALRRALHHMNVRSYE